MAQIAAQAAQATTPLEALRAARDLRRELDVFERQQVTRALADGTTFATIARYLGVTRQAAHRRYRSLAEAGLPLAVTSDARRLLDDAREQASARGADAVAGEHLLLAGLRAADLRAAAVLYAAGATIERARRLPNAAFRGDASVRRAVAVGELPTVLAAAAREARSRASRQIDAEHLLLGCLADRDGSAGRMLRALDVDIDVVRGGLAALLESAPA